MASADDIQAAVNTVTGCLNLLGDVDWAAYALEGPGMERAVAIAQSLTAQAGMTITLVAAVLDPIGGLAAALDQAANG